MTKLEKLMQEFCPDGVEYKPLKKISSITRGGNFQKKDYTENGVPCIHYGQIYTQYDLFVSKTLSYISNEVAKKQKFATTNDIIMAVTSENIEDVCKCVAWLGTDKIAVSGHTVIIHHNQNPKYLTYFFHSNMFFQQKKKIAHGTKVIEVTPDKLGNICVPLPPLPVQAEIVRILDNFTELTAELTARKKQYEYYRCALLFSKNYPVIQLSEIASFSYGYTDKAKDYGNARFIRITDILDNGCLNEEGAKFVDINSESEKYLLSKGDILMARTGATFGKTLWIPNNERAVYASFLIKIQLDNSKILNRYYWHFAQSFLYWEQAIRLVSSGGQPQFNANAVGRIKVPIPPLEEQKRIVSILDRFDKLCNDISEGLPAEIAARQKQYEYYRDKLLTFKELTP